ncbi:hypothetical protein [Gracilinema caldarium]|uniref:Uncharacterized protein n=1 Tax=Gracilinema caldarium (strain ATCC 51460 / DSM 7334 / H1) TaxID=744872 RepID=F8EX72_GRAC1|nr:hypothetical protein [Gracilinema caldarium]AEJ18815.1 hypothetical protein Spica_0661 [Gracilinema caldarium DSM 7334]
MKRSVVVVVMLMLGIPLFSQVRFDMGIDVPLGLGALSDNEVFTDSEVNDFFKEHILPFPELGLYYQFGDGSLRGGLGVRAFTFILVTVYWPNAFIEADLGNFTTAFQVGGGFFGIFGIVNDSDTGNVFIPDISLWYRFGKAFRLGGGVIGMMMPESDTMGFAYYVGFKFRNLFD